MLLCVELTTILNATSCDIVPCGLNDVLRKSDFRQRVGVSESVINVEM